MEAGEDAGRAGRGDGRGDRRSSPACGPSTASRSRCGSTRWSRASGPTSGSSSSATTWRCLKAKAAEIERVVKQIPGAADVSDRADHRAAGAPGRSRSATPFPATACPPGRCSTPSRRRAASRSARSWSRADGSRSSSGCRCPTATTRRPWRRCSIPTASGQRLPLTRLARLEETTGPSTIQREWGQRRIVVQANVRGRDIGSFVEGGPGADRPRGGATAGRLHDRVGRAVREHAAGRAAALHRRAAGPGPDPEPALPDVPLAPRRADDLQRRAVRPRRRRPRALWSWACRSPSRRASVSSPWPGRRCWKGLVLVSAIRDRMAHGVAEARGHRAGPAGPAAAGADDRHGRGPRVSCR